MSDSKIIFSAMNLHPYPCPVCDATEYDRRLEAGDPDVVAREKARARLHTAPSVKIDGSATQIFIRGDDV